MILSWDKNKNCVREVIFRYSLCFTVLPKQHVTNIYVGKFNYIWRLNYIYR